MRRSQYPQSLRRYKAYAASCSYKTHSSRFFPPNQKDKAPLWRLYAVPANKRRPPVDRPPYLPHPRASPSARPQNNTGQFPQSDAPQSAAANVPQETSHINAEALLRRPPFFARAYGMAVTAPSKKSPFRRTKALFPYYVTVHTYGVHSNESSLLKAALRQEAGFWPHYCIGLRPCSAQPRSEQ